MSIKSKINTNIFGEKKTGINDTSFPNSSAEIFPLSQESIYFT